jgi:hypothetical protein
MGDSGSAEKLRRRATAAPSNVPIPYPRFGMQDITTEPIAGYDPAVKTLVEEAARLLREREFERAGVAADQAFALIEALPLRQRYWEDDHFESIASAYSASGHKSEATAVLEREISASQRLWGAEHPAFARTLERVAWRYTNDLQALGPAHDLIKRAAHIISASDGQTSDAMSFIEDTKLRLAQLEGKSGAAAELKAKIREIWVTVHGVNTKPLVIH